LATRSRSIEEGFKEFAYLPHNSMLALWAYTGAAGFMGIIMPIIIALFLAARAHAAAASPSQAIAAASSMGFIAAYVLHMWGDIGFSEAHSIFLIGFAIAVAGQVATDTGAWPSRRRRAVSSH
jgi:O-antigen ligase